MRQSSAIDYEKLMEITPSPELIANETSYFQDERTLYVPSYDDGDFTDVNPIEMPQEVTDQATINPNEMRSAGRFNAGDIVVFATSSI